jgi:glycosyltransferase involved in cell wall biosynthesis
MLPQPLVEKLLTNVGKHPALNRQPSLIGMALDMEQRKRYLAAQVHLPDLVISPSKFLAAAFAFTETERPFVVQPHGHDLSWLESFEGKSACSHVRLGYIGQIQPIKGVDVILRAFLQLEEASDVSLDVWGGLEGNSAYTKEVRRLADASERIHLRGRYAHHDLAHVLSAIDVIIVSSICYENSPLVIHEAFAAKTPVIATNLGGMRELVQHEVNGLLFERSDVADLTHQMRRVITEPGLLEHLQKGIPPVMTVEQEARELISIYRATIVANAKGDNR